MFKCYFVFRSYALNLVKFWSDYETEVLRMEVNINDIANYRNCAKKLYSVYVCKPPKNTVVIRLSQNLQLFCDIFRLNVYACFKL